MVAKEWRDAQWKFAAATILVLVLSTNLTPYSEIAAMADETRNSIMMEMERRDAREGQEPPLPPPSGYDAEQMALNEMWGFYNVGGVVMLGSLAFVLGGVLMLSVAALRGYPMGEVSYAGVLLLALMMWLVSAFVLGVALLVSVLLRGTIPSLVVTALVLLAIFTFSENILNAVSIIDYRILADNQSWFGFFNTLAPYRYLIAPGVFDGESFGTTKFVYWIVTSAVPLPIALFGRRAY